MPWEYHGNALIMPGMPQYCRSNADPRNAAAFPRECRRNATGILQECQECCDSAGNARNAVMPGMPQECRECRRHCRGNAAAMLAKLVPRTHFCFNIEKSPVLDLCDHKSSSTYRTILSFGLTDRYDPKQAPKYPQCVSQIFSTKFFRDSKSGRPFTKTLFLKVIHAFLHQNRKIMTSGPL